MILQQLNVHQFRNLMSVQIPLSRVNIFLGDNGSGKTSCLEAIYYLGHGRSFRTIHSHHLINHQSDKFNIFAQIHRDNQLSKLGIEKTRHENKIKCDGEFIKNSSSLARLLPIQIINPDIHKLLEDSPKYRRKFIDWGVFHVEHSYGTLWKSFHSLLKQRNAALRKRWDISVVKHWNKELVDVVNKIQRLKQNYVTQLELVFQECVAEVDQLQNPNFSYYSGWPKDLSFEQALESSWEQDLESGFTRFGPHRSDLVLTFGKHRAKDVVSRGQQKVLAILLKLAQVRLYTKQGNKQLVLLVDDLASELDQNFTRSVIEILNLANCQLFVTATEENKIEHLMQLPGTTMFHVEHGEIK